jgi:demethylmenaquinone methyltransferase/2-methoxy-6-polyprenyl-1,4-benzoquinol methylase
MSSALPPDDQKALAVQAMFDRLAPSYDRVNRVMTVRLDQRWRRDVIRRLAIGPDDRVLDLACGTGDFWEIASATGADAIGVDFAPGMVQAARERHRGAMASVLGDALHLPFRAGAFTAAVSGFALRNFASLAPVFAELHRVLAPGGRIGLLEVDRPRQRPLRAGHAFYFGRVVPLIGGAISGDRAAYRYLPASTVYLPGQRELVRLLQAAGFHRIRKVGYGFGAAQGLIAVRP